MTWNRSLTCMFLLLLIPLAFSACAQKEVPVAKAGPGRMAELYSETGRAYVMTASQKVEVKEVAPSVKEVEMVVKKNGGHVQNQSLHEDDQAHLTLRIPPSQLIPTLDALASLGKEEYRYVSSEEVTEKVVDTEARLKNALVLRDRLKALLNQAKDVKDVLEIEKELARVQGDIDSMEGRLKKLKDQVDYAGIDLTLNRKKILGPLGYIVYGVGWVIQKLFVIQ